MSRLVHGFIAASFLAVAACPPEDHDDEQALGTVALPLAVPAPGEGTAQLLGAQFQIRHADGSVVATLSGGGQELALEQRLTAGDYVVELMDGWSLAITYEGGTKSYALGAFMIDSPNPAPFTVTQGKTSSVTFAFKRAGGVTIGIEAPERQVAGVAYIEEATGRWAAAYGGRAAFTWDIARIGAPLRDSSMPQKDYRFIDEAFAFDSGAPADLVSAFAGYENDARTSGLSAFHDAYDDSTYVSFSLGHGNVRLYLNGIADTALFDAAGYPLLTPFCVEEGAFALLEYEPESAVTSSAKGPASFCFD